MWLRGSRGFGDRSSRSTNVEGGGAAIIGRVAPQVNRVSRQCRLLSPPLLGVPFRSSSPAELHGAYVSTTGRYLCGFV